MREIPCKNCLILPICKAQVNDYIYGYKSIYENFDDSPTNLMYYACTDILQSKCSIIRNWMNKISNLDKNSKEFFDVSVLFYLHKNQKEIQ